jgi:hypothetical protein
MVALARRVFERPKLDEECPEWARDLIAFPEQEHGLGIPYEKIPQATLDELEYFFPLPEPPKRQRRIGPQPVGTKYARTCGLAVFLACLPFAYAKQLDLFADVPGEGTGEVAVLGLRKLADLAKQVGMSYDRVQRWMTILVTLGFIWRFRDGRRTLYVIPLTAYAPRPSAEGVRIKLTALIHSQFVEIEQADGQVVRADRSPEFTNLLLETRARFEGRYQLAPSLDLDLVEDPAWENTLSDIQKAFPGITRTDLYTILPIVARHLLQERGTGKGRHFVLKRNTIESTFSIESTADREQTTGRLKAQPQYVHAQQNGSKDGKRGTIESTFDGQGSHPTATMRDERVVASPTHSRVPDADQIGGKSRFNREANAAIGRTRSASQAPLELSGEPALGTPNLPLAASGSSLTLGSPELQESPQKTENTGATASSEREQGAELARIFGDQKSQKFYVSVFRQAKDEQLVRAVFIKTLHQEQNGGFTKSAGAYFKYMWDQWKVYRTYAAARDKWNHWGNKRDPKGIPPKIHELVTLYAEENYAQIANNMGHRWPETEQTAWLDASSDEEAPLPSMPLEEAEDLVEALRCYAGWYLRDPQIYQASAHVPGGFVVDALWPGGQVAVFATFDEWQDLHQQMLSLPEEIDAWFEAERVKHLQDVGGIDDGLSAQDKEGCVRVALAMYAYNGLSATSLPWEDLVVLGRPLLGMRVVSVEREEVTCEGSSDLLVDGGQITVKDGHITVRLDDGDLISSEDYQRTYDALEAEQLQEEEEQTYEGVFAVLQCELLLGLHLSVLGAVGLSMYQKLVTCGKEPVETGAVPGPQETGEGAEEPVMPQENQAASAAEGMLLGTAWLYLPRLRRALEPQFYQIRWCPVGSGTCSIVVESHLSGQSYIYTTPGQVEQALAELGLSAVEEAQES